MEGEGGRGTHPESYKGKREESTVTPINVHWDTVRLKRKGKVRPAYGGTNSLGKTIVLGAFLELRKKNVRHGVCLARKKREKQRRGAQPRQAEK